MLKTRFDRAITAVDTHPTKPDILALGSIEGIIECHKYGDDNESKKRGRFSFKRLWTNKLKRAVRDLKFSADGQQLFAIGANWSLCAYDATNGWRLRCIRKCHEARPSKLCIIPANFSTGQLATSSEAGEIKLWDFRREKGEKGEAQMHCFNEQEDVINAMQVHKHWLLSASADGTLAAYDLRRRKLSMQSEVMQSELLSIATTDGYTYVGASDGFIEVFITGQFGNLLERIETPFDMGVDCLLVVRAQLLLAGSAMADEMCLFHVNPNRKMKSIARPGGVDYLLKNADSSVLTTASAESSTLCTRRLPELISDIPTLRCQEPAEENGEENISKGGARKGKKRKKPAVVSDFYSGLCENNTAEQADEDS